MAQLKSEHVVQCLDSFLVRDRLCIVMEFLPLTLLDFLESQNSGRGLTSDVIRHIMYQVCKVMTFIHDQVCHFSAAHVSCYRLRAHNCGAELLQNPACSTHVRAAQQP